MCFTTLHMIPLVNTLRRRDNSYVHMLRLQGYMEKVFFFSNAKRRFIQKTVVFVLLCFLDNIYTRQFVFNIALKR